MSGFFGKGGGEMDDAERKLVEELVDDLHREVREKRMLWKKVKSISWEPRGGVCPVCRKSKTRIHLREGITACEDCLNVSEDILVAAGEPMRKEKLLLSLKLQSSLDRSIVGS